MEFHLIFCRPPGFPPPEPLWRAPGLVGGVRPDGVEGEQTEQPQPGQSQAHPAQPQSQAQSQAQAQPQALSQPQPAQAQAPPTHDS